MSGWWLAALWAAAAAWLITRAVRGRRSLDTLHADAPVSSSLPMVTVIVPVRNEADVIASCLAGLLAQNYPADRLAIIVVNDGSTDASGDILAQIAAAVPRLKVISAGPLPPGWVGKSHACWRGARLAQGEFLCFIDADTVAAPGLLEAAVGEAQSKNLDLLSLAPRQSLGSLLERLVIPAGMFVLAFAGVTSAVGQFMLIRRTAYDAIGGHAAVRQAIAEDGAMADLLTRTSHRVALMNGAPFMTVRLYRRGRDLWEGLSKN
ncbi:MAG TPA: glycosyltransferase family A protein, partial [Stellaceae bacterium]|nr:glycosyltransferase family A protein [Stellaceae bacterium]